MTLAPWRPILARSLHRNRALAHAKYFQLATVRANGRPANRTVVFRGFLPDRDRIAIVTDRRSQKIPQIERNVWAEICWYFPKTREQFRLAGTIDIIDAAHPNEIWQKAFHRTWQNLSEAARAQFYEVAPGLPRASAQRPPEPDAAAGDIPEPFRLLVFESHDVDYLNLQTHPHERCHYWLDRSRQWQTEWLTP
ncbi:Npun_F5749 family FMN-dependent PPOX-type flavoprotein [Altericista sp. CCNU0014]|uniref:Npun_F5749 family FMN-dependent PPOX-type flavoprotein n=1 Tax=Altericista sp. CCNU0014 TaxID=3082949 RepID=UPI00384C3C68